MLELTFRIDGFAAGIEFFVELPDDAEFISFENKKDLGIRCVTKLERNGVWIGLYDDRDIFTGTTDVGVITLHTNPGNNLKITEVYAYQLKPGHGGVPEVSALSASFVRAQLVNPTPKPSSPDRGGSSGGYGGYNDTDEPSPTPSIPTASQAPKIETITFTDLDSVPWAREAIEYLATYRGILGFGNGIFAPNDVLTRAQFSRFTTVALLLKSKSSNTDFIDVDPDDWFYNDVNTLSSLEIIEGYPDKTFRPNDPITREQMAVILLRALQYLKFDTIPVRPFTLIGDINDASEYAQSSIRTLYRAGLIEGVGNSRYNPHSGATRAEACVLLYRVIQVLEEM